MSELSNVVPISVASGANYQLKINRKLKINTEVSNLGKTLNQELKATQMNKNGEVTAVNAMKLIIRRLQLHKNLLIQLQELHLHRLLLLLLLLQLQQHLIQRLLLLLQLQQLLRQRLRLLLLNQHLLQMQTKKILLA